MKVWYLLINHIPTDPKTGEVDGKSFLWAHGKGDEYVPEEELTDKWLMRHGYKTQAAAKRGAVATARSMFDPWWKEKVDVVSKELPDHVLKYKIYRCYEIVIEDKDGNQIGDCDYVYTNRKDAEEMARNKLELTEMEE